MIGSGLFGIAAVLKLQEDKDLQVSWISEDTEAGGLWWESSRAGRVYSALYMITSRNRSGFSAHPIEPGERDRYLHHLEYRSYLAKCADLCTDAERVWGVRVTAVVPHGHRWRVEGTRTAGNDFAAEFDQVVSACGHYRVPRCEIPVTGEPRYEVLHSADYRNGRDYLDRSVLVVGAGPSAVDIACDLVPYASEVDISIRRGKWIAPKSFFGKPVDPSDGGVILKLIPARLRTMVARTAVRMMVGRYDWLGLDEPDHDLFDQVPTPSDYLVPMLSHRRLTRRPGVTALHDTEVEFDDGTRRRYDVVLAATGYRADTSHLPDSVRQTIEHDRLFLDVADAEAPGLYLLNQTRCKGGAAGCAELQAEVVHRMITGDIQVGKHPQADNPSRVAGRPLRVVPPPKYRRRTEEHVGQREAGAFVLARVTGGKR